MRQQRECATLVNSTERVNGGLELHHTRPRKTLFRPWESPSIIVVLAATQPDLTTQYTVVRSRTIFEPAVYVGLGASDNSHQLELSLNIFGVFYSREILVKFPDPRTVSPIMTDGAR